MRSPKQIVGPWSGERGGLVYPGFGGRLSLTSATPVTAANVTAAGSLYYTEHVSDLVTLPWRAGKWETFPLPKNSAGVAEIKAAFLANGPWALANATVYDVFMRLGIAGPELVRSPAWWSPSIRASSGEWGLVRTNGIFTLKTDPLLVWIGTIRSSAANALEDSVSKRFVWNAYNKVWRFMHVIEGTAEWDYATTTYRQANANSANQVEYVVGDAVTPIIARTHAAVSDNTQADQVGSGIGLDSTVLDSSITRGLYINATLSGFSGHANAEYIGVPQYMGYHYIAWLESGSNDATRWYGGAGGTRVQSGLIVEIMG